MVGKQQEATVLLLHLPVSKYTFKRAVKVSLNRGSGEEILFPYYAGLVRRSHGSQPKLPGAIV